MKFSVRPPAAVQKAPNWSKLGLGTGTLASLGRAASFSEVDRLVGAMLDIGITVIDTADSYGSGDCERLVGKVIRGRRGSFTLATKAGYRLSNLPYPLRPLNQFVKKGLQRLGFHQCFAPDYLAKCIDSSLSRLGVEHLDAFLLHNPPLEVVEDEEVLHLCRSLIELGKTTLTGLSSENPKVIRAAIASGAFGIIQTPASLKAATAMRTLWNECEAHQIRVVGNHVFDPACFDVSDMTHEMLMRGSSALLPTNATILCGTRNPSHLRQASFWASNPMLEADAERIVMELAP
jgi:pyridoxine 4-dehydrogenase